MITGGTGSLQTFNELFKNGLVIIDFFPGDEQKQFQMAQEFHNEQYPNIRYFIGDVRDKEDY